VIHAVEPRGLRRCYGSRDVQEGLEKAPGTGLRRPRSEHPGRERRAPSRTRSNDRARERPSVGCGPGARTSASTRPGARPGSNSIARRTRGAGAFPARSSKSSCSLTSRSGRRPASGQVSRAPARPSASRAFPGVPPRPHPPARSGHASALRRFGMLACSVPQASRARPPSGVGGWHWSAGSRHGALPSTHTNSEAHSDPLFLAGHAALVS
jgi:hypothetical protein